MFEPGKLVVYAPRERHFGWGTGVEKPLFPLAPMRVCRIVSRSPPEVPEALSRSRNLGAAIDPLEGGPRLLTVLAYWIPMEELPCCPEPFRLGSRITSDTIKLYGLDCGLFLSDSVEAGYYPGPKADFERLGIIAGEVYEIAEWLCDGKVVQLRGVPGSWYFRLFEPAEQAHRNGDAGA